MMSLHKLLSLLVLFVFVFSTITSSSSAIAAPLLQLPEPGRMVELSPLHQPLLLRGVTVHQDNPFLFGFIVDAGQDNPSPEVIKSTSERMVKYFMAALTVPAKDLWVNLSPYEKDRIVNESLGQTDMGRDMLAQDYLLKQLTASLIYPEKELGRKFWDKVYRKTQETLGSTQVTVNTFNKVWITSDRPEVYEHGQTAYVAKSHLKVMLEEDYLATQKHAGTIDAKNISAAAIRQVILPQLEKEVNEGRNFVLLRQIFNAIILAGWYKRALTDSLLNQAYADKKTVSGIDIKDKTITQQIFDRYVKAYKKGVFNYVKEGTVENQAVPRKYFSGGIDWEKAMSPIVKTERDGQDGAMSTAVSTVLLLVRVLLGGQSGSAGLSNNGKGSVKLDEKQQAAAQKSANDLADLFIENVARCFVSLPDAQREDEQRMWRAFSSKKRDSISRWFQFIAERTGSVENGFRVVLKSESERTKKLKVFAFLYFLSWESHNNQLVEQAKRYLKNVGSGQSDETNRREMHVMRYLMDVLSVVINQIESKNISGVNENDRQATEKANAFSERIIHYAGKQGIELSVDFKKKISESVRSIWLVIDEKMKERPGFNRLSVINDIKSVSTFNPEQRWVAYLLLLFTDNCPDNYLFPPSEVMYGQNMGAVTGDILPMDGIFLRTLLPIVEQKQIELRGVSVSGPGGLDNGEIRELEISVDETIGVERKSRAMVSQFKREGGIDLKDTQENTDVTRDGLGVQMKLDPAMAEKIRREGINTLTPFVYEVVPLSIPNVRNLLGLKKGTNAYSAGA